MNNIILAAKGSWSTAEFCRVTETVTHYFGMYSNLAVYQCLYFLSIHHAWQPHSGWPSNVFLRFSCRWV